MVAYLRDGRPLCPTRRVFVRIHAPHVGFAGPVAITNVVHRALTRAGIDPPFRGAHLLRHSLATAMPRHGASLEEIGQILRHAAPETTQIYASHLERSLRAIPTGRRNWLFAWTELGAQHVGLIQSLLVTCRLQGVGPYTYLVDVLQRIDQHPAKRVIELTPRVWKTLFADHPFRFDPARNRAPPLQ